MDTTTNNLFTQPIRSHGLRPTLVGGDQPPRGFRHKVFTVSNHHLYVLLVMSDHFNLADNKVLGNMIQHFIDHNRPLVDAAFEAKALINNKKYEGKDEQP